MCLKMSNAPTGTTETDTECEKCPHGSFSYSTSSRALCVNHTDCASLGRKTVLRGTCWHDNLCALSCEELKDGGGYHIIDKILILTCVFSCGVFQTQNTETELVVYILFIADFYEM